MPALLLAYEPEVACKARLLAEGFAPERAAEITSYLAQSTDIAKEFEVIGAACAVRGIEFYPVDLNALASTLPRFDPAKTLVWTLTDGIAYFRGAAAPALARLGGFLTIGADEALFALCQDKFRSGAVLRSLGLPCPAAGLVRDGEWIVAPPPSDSGWFVKPNRLGAKIGIWKDSHCGDLDAVLELSRRVFVAYRDDVIVQPYVAGRNVRASFLAVDPRAGVEALGVSFVDSGDDFQTMADSLGLYGETGEASRLDNTYVEPTLESVVSMRPDADAAIRTIAARLMHGLGLRDVFSLDLRLSEGGELSLIEFEVCPGLPCFDFRAYCRTQWSLDLPEAMAETASRRLLDGAWRGSL